MQSLHPRKRSDLAVRFPLEMGFHAPQEPSHLPDVFDRYELDPILVRNHVKTLAGLETEMVPHLLRDHDLELRETFT